MKRKNRKLCIATILSISVVLFIVYLIFFSGASKYNFFPYVLGSVTVFTIYGIIHFGRQSDELVFEDDTDMDCSGHDNERNQSRDGSMVDHDKH